MTQPNPITTARVLAIVTSRAPVEQPATAVVTTGSTAGVSGAIPPQGAPLVLQVPDEMAQHLQLLHFTPREPTLEQAQAVELRQVVRDPAVSFGVRTEWRRYEVLSDEELQEECARHREAVLRCVRDDAVSHSYFLWRSAQLVLASRALRNIIDTARAAS